MSMKLLTVLQLAGVFCAYLSVTVGLPAFVLGRKLKGHRAPERFLIYLMTGNFYVMNLVFVLQLLKISYPFTLAAGTLVPAAAAWIKVNRIPVRELFGEYMKKLHRLTGGQMGARTAVYKAAGMLRRQLARFGRYVWYYLSRRFFDCLLTGLLLAVLWYVYGSNLLAHYGYKASDLLVHNYWINSLNDNHIFVAGVYPHGFHCICYYLHAVFGIETFVILRVFAFVQNVMLHLTMLCVLRLCCRSRYMAYLGVFVYAASTYFRVHTYSRFYATLPQEFGILFILPAVYFGFAYFEARRKEKMEEKAAGKAQQKKKRRRRGEKREKAPRPGSWVYLAGFCMSFSMTLAVHFYGTMVAGLFCLAMAIGYCFLFLRKGYFLNVVGTASLSVVIAVLPMLVAFLMGTPLQGSLGWGMNIILGGGGNSSEEEVQTEGIGEAPEGETVPGAEGIGEVPEGETLPGTGETGEMLGAGSVPGAEGIGEVPEGETLPGTEGIGEMPGAETLPGTEGIGEVPEGETLPGTEGIGEVPGDWTLPGTGETGEMPEGESVPGTEGIGEVPGAETLPGTEGIGEVPGAGSVPGAESLPGAEGIGEVPGAESLPGAEGIGTEPAPPARPSLAERLKSIPQFASKAWKAAENSLSANVFQLPFRRGVHWVVVSFAALILLGALYLLLRKTCYGAMLISTGLFMFFLCIMMTAGVYGLPSLMDSNRGSIYFSYCCPVALTFLLDGVWYLPFFWMKGKTEKVGRLILNTGSLACVAGLFCYMQAAGHLRAPRDSGGQEMDETVVCLTNIIDGEEDFTWTIVSANDELRMGWDYGYHYETITFLEEMEDMGTDAMIRIPTPVVYFFIEKIPQDYNVAYEGSGQPVSEEGASLPLPFNSGIGVYQGEKRWIVMSKMYYWAEAFRELCPNEMDVYMETDQFICYRLEQNMYRLYNFAIDYGFNNWETVAADAAD